MLRYRQSLAVAAGIALALTLLAQPAASQIDGEQITPGGSCPPGAVAGQGNAGDWDTIFECNSSSKWQRGPYFFGATSDSCDSNHAGMVQWTGSSVSPNNTFEFCNGSSWFTVSGSASSPTLNSIAAATGSASIDSGANPITWAWNSLSTGAGLTISTSSALTGGTLLSLQATAASATSTGKVLSIADSTTGAGYGLYSVMTGTGNTGYAIYATNTGSGYALGATGTSTFNGYVGIGTASPIAPLHVNGSSVLFGTTSTTNGALYYYNGATPYFGIYNAGTATVYGISSYLPSPAGTSTLGGYFNGRGIGGSSSSGGNPIFGVLNSAQSSSGVGHVAFTIYDTNEVVTYHNVLDDGSGNVGIGTTTPQAALDVNGAARVGSTGSSCSSSNAGAVQYSSGVLEACTGNSTNGYNWIPIDSGMHYIGNAIASTTSSLQFDSANGNWSSSYKTLYLNCEGLLMSTNTAKLYVEIGESSGPTWENGAHYTVAGIYSGGSSADVSSGTQTDLSNAWSYSSTNPASIKLWIDDVASSAIWKKATMLISFYSGTGTYLATSTGYWANDTNPVTGLEVTTTGGGGTISSGTCSLDGMN